MESVDDSFDRDASDAIQDEVESLLLMIEELEEAVLMQDDEIQDKDDEIQDLLLQIEDMGMQVREMSAISDQAGHSDEVEQLKKLLLERDKTINDLLIENQQIKREMMSEERYCENQTAAAATTALRSMEAIDPAATSSAARRRSPLRRKPETGTATTTDPSTTVARIPEDDSSAFRVKKAERHQPFVFVPRHQVQGKETEQQAQGDKHKLLLQRLRSKATKEAWVDSPGRVKVSRSASLPGEKVSTITLDRYRGLADSSDDEVEILR